MMQLDKKVLRYWIKRLLLLVGVLLTVYFCAKILFQTYLDSSFDPTPKITTLDNAIPDNLVRGEIQVWGGGHLFGNLGVKIWYHEKIIRLRIAQCSSGGLGDSRLPFEYYKGQEVFPNYYNGCNGRLYWLTLQKHPSKIVIWRERMFPFTFLGAKRISVIDLPDNIDWQVGCYNRGYHVVCE